MAKKNSIWHKIICITDNNGKSALEGCSNLRFSNVIKCPHFLDPMSINLDRYVNTCSNKTHDQLSAKEQFSHRCSAVQSYIHTISWLCLNQPVFPQSRTVDYVGSSTDLLWVSTTVDCWKEIFYRLDAPYSPSVLRHCWLGGKKVIQLVKTWALSFW